MEHGLLYFSKKIIVNQAESSSTEPGILLVFTISIAAVAHATCARMVAHSYHTHAYAMSTNA